MVYTFTKKERAENCVCFWDIESDERRIKYVRQLMAIRAAGDNCVFATRDEEEKQFILILCNAIGFPVDSKYIDIEPQFVTMTPYHVICASGQMVHVWHYRTPSSKLGGGKKKNSEKAFHIDDASAGGSGLLQNDLTEDSICCITASPSCLVIGRASGTLLKYSLPGVRLDAQFTFALRPHRIELNCDSSKLAIVDLSGALRILDFEAKSVDAANKRGRGRV